MVLKEIFYDWKGLNSELFQYFNSLIAKNPTLGEILVFISELGTIFAIPYIVGFALLIFLINIYLNKIHHDKELFKEYFLNWTETLTISLFSIAATVLVAIFLKHYFGFLRPLCTYPHGAINIIPEISSATVAKMIAKRCNGDGSFPSLHSMIAIVLSISFWSISNLIFRCILIALAILIGISRLAIGVHYPADLIGGYIIGAIIFFISRFILKFCKSYFIILKAKK